MNYHAKEKILWSEKSLGWSDKNSVKRRWTAEVRLVRSHNVLKLRHVKEHRHMCYAFLSKHENAHIKAWHVTIKGIHGTEIYYSHVRAKYMCNMLIWSSSIKQNCKSWENKHSLHGCMFADSHNWSGWPYIKSRSDQQKHVFISARDELKDSDHRQKNDKSDTILFGYEAISKSLFLDTVKSAPWETSAVKQSRSKESKPTSDIKYELSNKSSKTTRISSAL